MESKWNDEREDFPVANSIVVELSEERAETVKEAISSAHAALRVG